MFLFWIWIYFYCLRCFTITTYEHNWMPYSSLGYYIQYCIIKELILPPKIVAVGLCPQNLLIFSWTLSSHSWPERMMKWHTETQLEYLLGENTVRLRCCPTKCGLSSEPVTQYMVSLLLSQNTQICEPKSRIRRIFSVTSKSPLRKYFCLPLT